MVPVLFASLFAGAVLSVSEYLFILFSCGPFWMTPWLLIETWAIYAATAFFPLLILNSLLVAVPGLKNRFSPPRLRLLLLTTVGWVVAAALLVILVSKDLRNDNAVRNLMVIISILGFSTSGFVLFFIKDIRRIIRRGFSFGLALFFVAIIAYFIPTVSYSNSIEKRSIGFDAKIPHLCLLVLDTTRGDRLSCYGYDKKTTPNIDRIAAEGLLCADTYSAANWTPPGHISIFTGKYPLQHGNNGKPFMPDDLLSITEILNRHGFFCVALYNNPIAGKSINLTQGFDVDVGVWGNTWVLPAWLRIYQKFVIRDSGSKATFPMASAVFDWVQKRGGHLFLYINVTEPHQEYVPHEPYYSDFSRGLRLDTLANRARLGYLCKTRDLVLFDSTKFAGFTDDDYRYLTSVYDSELAYMDANFGGFSQNLRESGLLDQTLLVITADHGEFLGEYWTVGHPELLLNPVLRIPLILRYPELIEPQVRRDLTSNVDIFPTVLNLLGYEEDIPSDIEGRNLMQGSFGEDRLVLSANAKDDEGVYSITDGRYKLIVNADTYLPQYFPYDTLLFDLQVDPDERHNLFPADGETAARLSAELEEWSARIKVRSKDSITISEETIENLKALGYVH